MNEPTFYNEKFDNDVVEVSIPGSMEALILQLNSVIEKKISNYYRMFRLEDLNLDPRGGDHIWVDTKNAECVVILLANKQYFNYYCDGQYIDAKFVQTIGDYVVLMNDGKSDVDRWIRAAIEQEENAIKNQSVFNLMKDVATAFKVQDFDLLRKLRKNVIDHPPVEVSNDVRGAIIEVIDILLDGISQTQDVENV